jgi:Ni,Fe-hydrogenase III large subunit
MSAITEKLSKVNESFTVNRYDNGFMIEVGGRDEENDWKTAKVIVGTEEELIELIQETLTLPLAD